MNGVNQTRSFLFLQGVASPFFSVLARQLRLAGHRTHRMNFCGGDWLLGLFQSHTNYRGALDGLPQALSTVLAQHRVTDMVLFGDCRQIHQLAMGVARHLQVCVHVFEEGYLRPDWITLEQGGVNGFSAMSRVPEEIKRWAADASRSQVVTPHLSAKPNLSVRATYDIIYRLASTALVWFFPSIRTHRPHNGLLEYAGLARRFGLGRRFEYEARQVIAGLLERKTPFYLFALQLNADFQIKCHSPFPNCLKAIDHVLMSFAVSTTSPELSRVCLVVKNHPLDTGLSQFRSYTKQRAETLGIANRVHFIEAGDLNTLLTHARGVVLVNSTVGMTALALRRPVMALGKAIFGLPGLTHQGELQSFWKQPESPDSRFVEAFMDYVTAHSLVNGDFYSREGIRRGAVASAQRMLGGEP